MSDGRRNNKIHIRPQDTDQVQVGTYEVVISLCDRPVPADISMDIEIAAALAERNFSKQAFCAICLSKTEIEFPEKKAEGRNNRRRTAVLERT